MFRPFVRTAVQIPKLVRRPIVETLNYRNKAQQRAKGTRSQAIVGVVASGNLEVLVERILPDGECEIGRAHV